MSKGTRLDVAARRAQLIETGIALFGARPADEVDIAEIARAAGVSRGLLYHYFPDKVAFFVAVAAHQVDALAEATRADPADPFGAQLAAGLDSYFRFVETHPHWYRSLYRSAVATDPAVRALIDRAHERQAERVLGLVPELEPTPLRRLAVRGWISFLVTAGLALLDGAAVDPDDLRERCAEVLVTALGR